MTRSVLFVDDEPRVLDGLRRGLRDLRHDWDLHFALGGCSALDALHPGLRLVVTDMRMPDVDGNDVLTAARDRAPYAARVVLSGNSDRSTARRAVGLAHRFLSKPCETALLQTLLPELVGYTDSAPQVAAFRPPAAHVERVAQLRLLIDAGAVPDAVDVAEQDPALVLVLLHAAASSAFLPGRACEDVRTALEHLGLVVVRELLDDPALVAGGPRVEPAAGSGLPTVRALAGLGTLLPAGSLGPLLRLWGLPPGLTEQAEAVQQTGAAA